MIKSIIINNFQSHKDTEIEFGKGVNVIKGTSDSGKSSTIRALKWVSENKPLGFAFRSNFAKKNDVTKVKVNLFDDRFVVRERKQNKSGVDELNRYLTPEHDKKDPLEAFGKSGAPDEIKEILCLSDYNIQSQHDKYFLLQDSPGEVARQFNDIVGLTIIDDVVKKTKAIISRSRDGVKNADQEIESIKNDLQEFRNCDEIEKKLNKLGEYLKDRDLLREKRKKMFSLMREIKALDEEIEHLDNYLKIEKELKETLKFVDEVNEIIAERDRLKEIIDKIGEVNQDIKDLDYDLECFDQVEKAVNDIQEYKREQNNFDELVNLIQDIENIDNEIPYIDKKIEIKDKEIKEFGICPYCQKSLGYCKHCGGEE